MQFFTLIAASATLLASVASAGQVNFYSDKNCKNYIDHRFPGSYEITGGPAGSFSALWVSGDQSSCSRSCGPYIICGDKNCNNRKGTSIGKCISFDSGVWAKNGCGNEMC